MPFSQLVNSGTVFRFGNQVLTDGRLSFDSIYRFKGQEAPAVVLVDVDPDSCKFERCNGAHGAPYETAA